MTCLSLALCCLYIQWEIGENIFLPLSSHDHIFLTYQAPIYLTLIALIEIRTGGKHTSKKYFPVDLPEGDWSDSESQPGAPQSEKASKLPKRIVVIGIIRSKSSKTPSLPRKRRTKSDEMTLEDEAKKRRRTKGIPKSNIFKKRPGLSIEVQSCGDRKQT